MERKGVSPLIAAVLLIAFTMAVAAILTAWITSFTTAQTEIVGNQSAQAIQCSFASLSIFDAVWEDESDELVVSIANTGNTDFSEVTVIAIKGTEINRAISGTLISADIISVTIDGVSSKPDRVRVVPKECPNLFDEESSVSVA